MSFRFYVMKICMKLSTSANVAVNVSYPYVINIETIVLWLGKYVSVVKNHIYIFKWTSAMSI